MRKEPCRKNNDFMGHRQVRPFKRGDFKYIILHFLKEKPSHGYEIMMALQERFHRFYVPSPGSIYPTLQMLDDMDYISSTEREGKRVYTITEKGREFLDEQKDFMERMEGRIKDWCNPENIDDISKTRREFEKLARLLKENLRIADAEKLGKIRQILSRACEEIAQE